MEVSAYDLIPFTRIQWTKIDYHRGKNSGNEEKKRGKGNKVFDGYYSTSNEETRLLLTHMESERNSPERLFAVSIENFISLVGKIIEAR